MSAAPKTTVDKIVRHPTFGQGIVIASSDEEAQVFFRDRQETRRFTPPFPIWLREDRRDAGNRGSSGRANANVARGQLVDLGEDRPYVPRLELIRDTLPRTGVAFIGGQSGALKSFFCSLAVKIVEIGEDGTEADVADHPAAALLRHEANDWTSGFELIRQLVVDALCRDQGGTAWVNWLRDQPVEIIRYRPGIIAAEYDTDGSGRPSYRINGRSTPAQEIIHLKSTFDKCPVTLCREAIGVALVMEKHAARLFGRGARPGGIIRTKKNVGDEGVRKMLAGWKAAHEGADNSGKTAVLWDDAEYQQTALNSVDSQFQQLRLFQLQEIARAFNMPASMLGDLTRATWSNSAEMQRQFLMLCLEPWLQALEGAFRRALFSREDRERFAVRFDRDDFTNVDLTARATAINSLVASRVLNPNEGRSWLDMPPRAGGDEFANPNTGASQPSQQPPKPDDDPEKEEMRRKIEELTDVR